jgi:hypothetical protein
MANSGLCDKSPFSTFTITVSLFGVGGEWLDLTHGNSGVWVWGPKLWFQTDLGFVPEARMPMGKKEA